MYGTTTAKIPLETKRQGDSILRSMGSTPTQLVNAAYEYVLAHHKLPKAFVYPVCETRKLTAEQLKRITERNARMRIDSDVPNGNLKDLIAEALENRYEALS